MTPRQFLFFVVLDAAFPPGTRRYELVKRGLAFGFGIFMDAVSARPR